eukprot:CAMPEP_0172903694 /NCGR_PEP_ID=MMETSP1075-20121228/171125_1 /TAXON_ID=2916 /ORGANISM="Ceratium fusus, Strain PA161109" /LENGTH=39 /DNA_ID= /DNA_START= /DNA_END= /DNA_ORIENTATION=
MNAAKTQKSAIAGIGFVTLRRKASAVVEVVASIAENARR